MSKVENGSAPIITEGISVYSNPLPHVLILTAIVVGVATTALALALVVRIRDSYGSIEEDEIEAEERHFLMLLSNLPALQVVLPLVAAPICLILRRSDWSWLCAVLVTWACLAISICLLLQVLSSGLISYPIGDWAAPWGIEYKVDILSAFLLVIVSSIGAIVLPYAHSSVSSEIPEARIYLFYTMYLLCLCGLLGIAITGDAFNLFVFLEVSSLSSYVLISMGRYRRSLTAAYRYLIMGTVGATFYIIGVGMMYMMTGTLNMTDLAESNTCGC